MSNLYSNEKYADAYLIITDATDRKEGPFPIHRAVLAGKSRFFTNMFDFPGRLETYKEKPLFFIDISSLGTIQECLNIIELCYKDFKEIYRISSLVYNIKLFEYFVIEVYKFYEYNLEDRKFESMSKTTLGPSGKTIYLFTGFQNRESESGISIDISIQFFQKQNSIEFSITEHSSKEILRDFLYYIDPLSKQDLGFFHGNVTFTLIGKNATKRVINVIKQNNGFLDNEKTIHDLKEIENRLAEENYFLF